MQRRSQPPKRTDRLSLLWRLRFWLVDLLGKGKSQQPNAQEHESLVNARISEALRHEHTPWQAIGIIDETPDMPVPPETQQERLQGLIGTVHMPATTGEVTRRYHALHGAQGQAVAHVADTPDPRITSGVHDDDAWLNSALPVDEGEPTAHVTALTHIEQLKYWETRRAV